MLNPALLGWIPQSSLLDAHKVPECDCRKPALLPKFSGEPILPLRDISKDKESSPPGHTGGSVLSVKCILHLLVDAVLGWIRISNIYWINKHRSSWARQIEVLCPWQLQLIPLSTRGGKFHIIPSIWGQVISACICLPSAWRFADHKTWKLFLCMAPHSMPLTLPFTQPFQKPQKRVGAVRGEMGSSSKVLKG